MMEDWGGENLAIGWEYSDTADNIVQDRDVIPASFSRVAMPANALTSILTRVPTNTPTLATATPTSVPTNAPIPAPAGGCTEWWMETVRTILPWSSTTTYNIGDLVYFQESKYMCEGSDVSLCNRADYAPSNSADMSWKSVWIYQAPCFAP